MDIFGRAVETSYTPTIPTEMMLRVKYDHMCYSPYLLNFRK